MKGLSFFKMQGIGNDFIMLNNFSGEIPFHSYPELAIKICDRHFGIGSDGVIILEKSDTHAFKMRMLNPDGTESGACGNGTRCFAVYLKALEVLKETVSSVTIEGPVGPLVLNYLENNLIQVDMGKFSLKCEDIPVIGHSEPTFCSMPIDIEGNIFFGTGVSMGNPHLVIFTQDLESIPLEKYGPILEYHPLFKEGTNVHFAKVLSSTHLKMRTWERGAGITLACGSGACATAVAALELGLTENKVQIDPPGGSLWIEVNSTGHVLMSGPAEIVFTGTL